METLLNRVTGELSNRIGTDARRELDLSPIAFDRGLDRIESIRRLELA